MAPKLYRRCICCQRFAPREEFWRVVRVQTEEPNTSIQLDRGMGRSAYICQSASCLQQAHKKNRLGRSLRTAVPPEIFTQLEMRLNPNPLTFL